MPFIQLSFATQALEAERVEAACFAAGALSVTLTDAADTPILEPPLGATPLWPDTRVAALFAGDSDRVVILDTLKSLLGRMPPGCTFTEVKDRAWERECLADLEPIRFGRRLWVSPLKREVPAADAVVLRLDPGLAFGTGTHATTAMCLEWLDAAVLKNAVVLDYGCGSGILAIAAIKLGAAHAIAVDHDPQALLATRENAERNGVAGQIEILPPDTALPLVDALLANILALPLIELAPTFQTTTRPGSHLVLSGILADQADAVTAAYGPWFEMDTPCLRDGWVRLHGVRYSVKHSISRR